MERTSRRNLLRAAAVGGVAASGLGAVLGTGRTAAAAAQNSGRKGDDDEHKHGDDDDEPLSGRRAQATVSFGQWSSNPPFDRQPVNSDRTRNVHLMLPFEVEIDAGGAVSFIISGVHQILIYKGRKMEDLREEFDTTVPSPVIPPPPAPPLVNIATDRVYRGLDPRVLTYATLVGDPAVPLLVEDRVESVNLSEPGRYLVVCGVLPHFLEGMHGYVRVRR
jgi:hypothetical protein